MAYEQTYIGGIQRFSTEDGPGIRTSVFVKGCPLKCRWCHNPELISYRNQHLYTKSKCIGCGACMAACPRQALALSEGQAKVNEAKCIHCFSCVENCYSQALRTAAKKMSVNEVMDIVRRDKAYYDRTKGGLTISGGEMLTHPDFVEELMEMAQKEEIGVALDTSGYGDGGRLYAMAQKCQYILYDMKCIKNDIHKKATGVSNDIILENLERLAADKQINPKIWIRMPLIHGLNDTEEIIRKTADFLESRRLTYVTLLPYHKLGISKYEHLGQKAEEFEPPSGEQIREIQQLFIGKGIKTEILGEKIQ